MEICQAATGAMLPLGLETVTVAERETTSAEQSSPQERVASSQTPFFLPFAQAPPAGG
jgi:hypothetical protein